MHPLERAHDAQTENVQIVSAICTFFMFILLFFYLLSISI
ncbi:hypothetical protein BRYFOR_07134 [Marvinbryantia formatexigens DSM 14469]|uniref:Uncharacterized protein n=1 Tax=Marvinbryantia formatexigens DSM 14469 TaxID=478749 RepID=C6LET3_9FIRM|nr:hypothetical protein BRYFOR_07134 [Marvinbryantia formatexigens DSM 14469]